MSLRVKVKIKNKQYADYLGLDFSKKYEPTSLDEEGYYIRHPFNDEEILLKYNDVVEFDEPVTAKRPRR